MTVLGFTVMANKSTYRARIAIDRLKCSPIQMVLADPVEYTANFEDSTTVSLDMRICSRHRPC